jgi:hypothetical protein
MSKGVFRKNTGDWLTVNHYHCACIGSTFDLNYVAMLHNRCDV